MIKILFVCMGNICRSPTAHAVMQHKIDQQGLDDKIWIDSAGTHAYHVGNPADHRAQQEACRQGIDMQGLRARKIAAKDYDEFDYILAMDEDNLELINHYAPDQHKARLLMFLHFANQMHTADRINVPDPYYGGADGFSDVFDLVDRGCDALLEYVLGN